MTGSFTLIICKSQKKFKKFYSYDILRIIGKIGEISMNETNEKRFINDPVPTGMPQNNEPPKQDVRGQLKNFSYTIQRPNGKKFKSTFEAYNAQEVRNFFANEGYQVIDVKVATGFNMNIGGPKKLKAAELAFMLTQLATYLRAGIPLIDSVRILAKQSTSKERRKIFERVVYDLLTGESFSRALARQSKIFPRLLINMVKTAELTGDLPAVLDDMSDYYTSSDQTRRQMISAMTYPTVIFFFAIIVVSFILMYVVPQFVSLFNDQGAALPTTTKLVISASNFLRVNSIWIVIGILALYIIYRILFMNVRGFKKGMQTFYMKLPVISKIIIYNEVTMFTKTFASLLNHGVQITDSMEVLANLTDNEIYKSIIDQTLANLSKGSRISDAFKDHWAFPVIAYEMLVTGENTGKLGLMMGKVADYFALLHKNVVDQIKSLVEPTLIALLAVAAGFIILSIVQPMFGIYNAVL